jgi:hypothetical protein
MLQLFADKLAVGALLISQLLLTAVVGTEPYFQNVNLVVNGDRLFCSGNWCAVLHRIWMFCCNQAIR